MRDLVAIRARALGLTVRPSATGLQIDGDASTPVVVAIVATVDAEALELCGRDGTVAVLGLQSPFELLDLALVSAASPGPTDGLVLDPQIAARLARRVARAEPLGAHEGLTAREEEVLSLLATGLALKQIGLQLGITAKTVENHATKLYAKLGVRNRHEAVTQAARR